MDTGVLEITGEAGFFACPLPLDLELELVGAHGDPHPAAAQAGRGSQVADEPFVMIKPTSLLRRQCEQLCAEAEFEPNIAFVADDLPTLRGYVAAGLGVAIAPALWGGSVAAPVVGLHVLALTDRGATREVGLSWAPQRRMLPAAELFREHALARARAGKLPEPV